MASSLSNLVNNLAKRIHRHDNKKRKACRIKYKDCKCCLGYKRAKDNLREYKYLCCNKNYQKLFDEKLKNRYIQFF